MDNNQENPEFWEAAFKEKREMWGFEPAKSALLANQIFTEQAAKNVLIPGFGYGRNAKVFVDSGMSVTGIEISETAINLAHKQFTNDVTIDHGSVIQMPYDDQVYDGVFCYALIHLLEKDERAKLIKDCYDQTAVGGTMIFTAISKKASTYGQGKFIGKDQYELFGGIRMFFYDNDSILSEFSEAGVSEISEITENFPFYFIKCVKNA